jgi:hypothetical protein
MGDILINQFVLFDTEEDGLFIQTNSEGELMVVVLDNEKDVNIWDIFPDVDDKELLIECLIKMDPKLIDRSKHVRDMMADMLITGDVIKFDITYNNKSTTVYGARVKNGIRKYIRINVSDYLVYPGQPDSEPVAPVQTALQQSTNQHDDDKTVMD